jgi:hypothetical protein
MRLLKHKATLVPIEIEIMEFFTMWLNTRLESNRTIFTNIYRVFFLSFLILVLADCSKGSSSKNESETELVTFADVLNCKQGLDSNNLGLEQFIRKDTELGLVHKHGFAVSSWLNSSTAEVMFSGGLTAVYLDNDCWPDIVFASGDENGMVAYVNKGNQSGFINNSYLIAGTTTPESYKHFTGVAAADLNGNYQRELIFGNLFPGNAIILSNTNGIYYEFDRLPVSRSTYGISFADINGNNRLDMYLSHWGFGSVDGGAPVLWFNLGDGIFSPYDDEAGIGRNDFDQRFNFTPIFADLRDIGINDLLVVSDFGTSAVLLNDGNGSFSNVTDQSQITDENGMGGALGDINNNGKVDWFVTSIFDPDGVAEGNWGVTGNRLYQNLSTKSEIIFSDITEEAGVRDGNWGWGACMVDFNNDAFLDIFHVNGAGYFPEEVQSEVPDDPSLTIEFVGQLPRLFINNGDGSFTDRTVEWGLDVPSEGRGVICFDYDRDGDIDIALVDHSSGIQFFENQTGHGNGKRFLNIRLVGAAPNTDAIGTKVFATANVGNGFGVQRQMRMSQANSNFNSQNLPDIHFGLGSAVIADFLRIEWPDGTGLICRDVSVDQFLVFDQRNRKPESLTVEGDCTWHEDIKLIIEG